MPNFHSNEIYSLEMYNRQSGGDIAYCDLLVVDSSNTIFAANLIGQDSKVKQVAWCMQEGKSGQISRAEGNKYETGHMRHSVFAIGTKKTSYDEELIKIDDLTQILIIAKNAKPDIKARNTWQVEQEQKRKSGGRMDPLPDSLAELILAWDGDYRSQVFAVLDDRYNTPMLPEWKEYILDELESRNLYEPLRVETFGNDYALQAGLLKITEQQLEDLITEAVQGYAVEFAIEEDGRRPEEGVLHNLRSIDDYLAHFAGDLGARILENVSLRFDPSVHRHHPAFHNVNLQANQNGITGLYPPQANTVMGVSRTLQKDKFCFIVGEMG